MAYDALNLSVLCGELKQTLVGGKITKIYQPERDEIILFVFNKQTYRLLISANAGVNRIHLTEMPTDNPKTAPSFCMLLRKHITNATVTDVTQMPYERVVQLDLYVTDELGYKKQMYLIFELTGKTSNIILADGDYTVLDSIKHLPQDINSKRIIMTGTKYTFFLPQDKIVPFDYPRVQLFLSQCRAPLRTVLPETLLGVSQDTVNEITCGLDENDHSDANNARVMARLKEFEQNLSAPRPNVVLADGTPTDVCPFDYRSKKGEKIYYATLNKAHDNYYYLLDKAKRFADKAKSVSTLVKNAVSRTEKKLALQRQCVLEAEDRERFKQYGDLILSNLWAIRQDSDSLTCADYYNGGEVTIPLDKALSPQQNAQAYYKKYRKLKSSAMHNAQLAEQNAKLLDYLITVKQSLRYCTDYEDLLQIRQELADIGLINDKRSGKKAAEPPVRPLRYEIDGYTVWVGKNNVQNNFVTFKLAKSTDIWLHTHAVHSSHVIVVNDKTGDVPDNVITAAAEICAYYSQANGGGKTDVDYTAKANVKKPPKAALGYVIYNTYRTVTVNPDRHIAQLVL